MRRGRVSTHARRWCVGWSAWLGITNHNILGEGLESRSILLNHGDGHMTGLAGVDVRDGAGFAGMCAADNLAVSAVFKTPRRLCFDGQLSFLSNANASGNARAEWRGACRASAVTRGPTG